MKKNIFITCISTFLICIALITSLFFDNVIGGRISQIVTLTTALIGAAALFVQYVRDKKINQSSFILEFSKSFYDPVNLGRLMNKLDSNNLTGRQNITKYDYNDIVNYLQWCESLAALVLENIISIDGIDQLFSYRFFLITNNEIIQKKEILPSKEFYRGIYLLHYKWEKYKRRKNLKILNEETSLSKTEGYNEFILDIINKRKSLHLF